VIRLLCLHKGSLDISAYLIISIFEASVILSFALNLIKVCVVDVSSEKMQLSAVIAQYVIYSVIAYFTYELAVVFTKVSSDEPQECLRKLRIKKIVFIVMMIALTTSYTTEIIDKLDVADENRAL
jgi:hypothetical protein